MHKVIPFIGFLSFIINLYINYIAGQGGINDTTTGEVSDAYPTLFTPAGFTFAIWGLIYFLNFIFIIYQVYKSFKAPLSTNPRLNALFILINILSILWLHNWHHKNLGLAVLIILIMLTALVTAYRHVSGHRRQSTDYLFERINFSVYLAWICVAVTANIAIYLTAAGWPVSNTTAMIITGLVIALITFTCVLMIIRERNISFGLVVIWALYGIIMSRSTLDLSYDQEVAIMALTSMLLIFLLILFRKLVFKLASKHKPNK